MLFLVQLWIALAILVSGIITLLVGVGTFSLSHNRLYPNRQVGDTAIVPAILAVVFLFTGLLALLSTILQPLLSFFPIFALGAMLLFGLQLGLGYARLESNSTLTLLRTPKTNTGHFSRIIGAAIAAAAALLLLAALPPFQRFAPANFTGIVISVCASLFAAILVNVLTGGVIASDSAWKWLPTLFALLVSALILSQTSLWDRVPDARQPTPAAPAASNSETITIHPAKSVLRVNEQTTLTVSVDERIAAPTFSWTSAYGVVPGGWLVSRSITYTAPSDPTVDWVQVNVRDRDGHTAGRGEIKLQVLR